MVLPAVYSKTIFWKHCKLQLNIGAAALVSINSDKNAVGKKRLAEFCSSPHLGQGHLFGLPQVYIEGGRGTSRLLLASEAPILRKNLILRPPPPPIFWRWDTGERRRRRRRGRFLHLLAFSPQPCRKKGGGRKSLPISSSSSTPSPPPSSPWGHSSLKKA